MKTGSEKSELRFRGISASAGIAVGRLRVVDRRRLVVNDRVLPEQGSHAEIGRLKNAILRSRDELIALKEDLRRTSGSEHLHFIETHQLILADERLFIETVAHIENAFLSAESALRRTLATYRDMFSGIDDSYLKERIGDVEMVIDKILRNLVDEPHAPIPRDDVQTIVAAHDLSPADILQMDRQRVVGMATEIGGRTSHASILARAFELPAVAGAEGIADPDLDGLPAIVDGLNGEVIVNPRKETFLSCLERKRHFEYIGQELLRDAALPAVTLDGHPVMIGGNVEIPEEGSSVLRHGGEGVGLYRTEMLFMNREEMPDEEEQFQVYAAMQQAVAPNPLTIRTLDAGGDKLLDGMAGSEEQNPALGVRAIRLSLRVPEEFKKQVRAILRVSASGPVRLMFPMISGLDELRAARALLDAARRELDAASIPHDRSLPVGIMIEVPSAVLVADMLAHEVDFFSIGTNDLIQYTLAIDRSNRHLAEMFQPFHPAVLRSLKIIADAADRHGIEAGICGEMAGDPLYLQLLLGLGFRSLSMSPVSIPRIKRMIRNTDLAGAQRIAAACLSFETAAQIDSFLKKSGGNATDGLDTRSPS